MASAVRIAGCSPVARQVEIRQAVSQAVGSSVCHFKRGMAAIEPDTRRPGTSLPTPLMARNDSLPSQVAAVIYDPVTYDIPPEQTLKVLARFHVSPQLAIPGLHELETPLGRPARPLYRSLAKVSTKIRRAPTRNGHGQAYPLLTSSPASRGRPPVWASSSARTLKGEWRRPGPKGSSALTTCRVVGSQVPRKAHCKHKTDCNGPRRSQGTPRRNLNQNAPEIRRIARSPQSVSETRTRRTFPPAKAAPRSFILPGSRHGGVRGKEKGRSVEDAQPASLRRLGASSI
jgi:hypothetical protein